MSEVYLGFNIVTSWAATGQLRRLPYLCMSLISAAPANLVELVLYC